MDLLDQRAMSLAGMDSGKPTGRIYGVQRDALEYRGANGAGVCVAAMNRLQAATTAGFGQRPTDAAIVRPHS